MKTDKFVTMFTVAYRWNISWAILIHSIYYILLSFLICLWSFFRYVVYRCCYWDTRAVSALKVLHLSIFPHNLPICRGTVPHTAERHWHWNVCICCWPWSDLDTICYISGEFVCAQLGFIGTFWMKYIVIHCLSADCVRMKCAICDLHNHKPRDS